MKKAIIYIHGKGGNYLEAEQYKKNCPGFEIYGIDFNDYLPWSVQNEFIEFYNDVQKNYDKIFIIANSIGAYLAMHSLQKCKFEKALFISPILDMEQLILDMMKWANISEKELAAKGEIQTDFGEVLSWEYLCFVRENPIIWNVETEILYAEHDNLTSRKTIDEFVNSHDAHLTIKKNGEHWFHTDEQIEFLNQWMKKVLNKK